MIEREAWEQASREMAEDIAADLLRLVVELRSGVYTREQTQIIGSGLHQKGGGLELAAKMREARNAQIRDAR